MNPEEKELLERTLKLSEENNKLLHQIRKTAKRAAIWGFIKLVIIVTPLVVGYFYLQPLFKEIMDTYSSLVGSLSI